MGFLRNSWYAAGWAADLTDRPLGRTFLGEHVVLFRRQDGRPAALTDRCPHRFAPLSLGKVVGDQIACPYHGLRFDASGACRHSPHTDPTIPNAARLRAYPVAERHGMLWIWMGEPERADESLIVDYSLLDDTTGYAWVFGTLHVKGHYELVTDNLLDLSHAEFLHPALAQDGIVGRTIYRGERDGDTVYAFNETVDEKLPPLFKPMWDKSERVRLRSNMRWDAPGNLLLDTGFAGVGEDWSTGLTLPTAHILTPETETTTHYFWASGRDFALGSPEVGAAMREGLTQAFKNEDEPMIAAIQSRMDRPDLLAMRPALLAIDTAVVLARRILARRIAEEQKAVLQSARMPEPAE